MAQNITNTDRVIFFGAPVVGAVGGAIAGSAISPKHPVIGALGGAAVGTGLGDLVSTGFIDTGRLHFFGATMVGAVAGAAAGSAIYAKHPAIGGAIGALLGVGAGLTVIVSEIIMSGMGGNAQSLGTDGVPQALPTGSVRCPHFHKLVSEMS